MNLKGIIYYLCKRLEGVDFKLTPYLLHSFLWNCYTDYFESTRSEHVEYIPFGKFRLTRKGVWLDCSGVIEPYTDMYKLINAKNTYQYPYNSKSWVKQILQYGNSDEYLSELKEWHIDIIDYNISTLLGCTKNYYRKLFKSYYRWNMYQRNFKIFGKKNDISPRTHGLHSNSIISYNISKAVTYIVRAYRNLQKPLSFEALNSIIWLADSDCLNKRVGSVINGIHLYELLYYRGRRLVCVPNSDKRFSKRTKYKEWLKDIELPPEVAITFRTEGEKTLFDLSDEETSQNVKSILNKWIDFAKEKTDKEIVAFIHKQFWWKKIKKEKYSFVGLHFGAWGLKEFIGEVDEKF